jgi:hypothetical protein
MRLTVVTPSRVEHDADRNLEDGVGPEEGAEKQPQIGRS